MHSSLLVPSYAWHWWNPSSSVLKLSTSDLACHRLECTPPYLIYIFQAHSWTFLWMNGYIPKNIWDNFCPLQILLKSTSFWRVVDLGHHSPISTPTSPSPLYIPDNQTYLILCLLAATVVRFRMGNLFDLIVERINFIVNLIDTTLINDIRNLWYSTC